MLIRRDHRDPSLAELEVVERKGRGHPDTLADTISEALSVVYSRECLARFGAILHHNVDKLSIGGGLVESGYGWERYRVPVTVVVNGRMSSRFGEEQVPIRELADTVARDVLFQLLPHLDFERGVRLDHRTTDHSRHDTWFRPRSLADLPELTAPTASDSTVSVGYWPLTPTERLALRLEEHVAAAERGYEWCGGDVKVLCVREGRNVAVTMSVPFISTAITSESDYLERLSALARDLEAAARESVADQLTVDLCLNNSLRNPYRRKQPYLLATGSCIECGEEGVVGRGNPPAGVISSMRPHSVEAAYGKNPVYHAGKVYALITRNLARAIAEASGSPATVIAITRHSDPLLSPSRLIVETRGNMLSDTEVRELSEEVIGRDHLDSLVRRAEMLAVGELALES